mmetsp:Transcript_2676/g.2322  ORF Transcript_2676/g.2322 Transcript_2676/m.2322 type:complete len:109 (+) Transcript_2676:387-713(+)
MNPFMGGGMTQEEYDRIVEEFIRNDPNQYGKPPASEEDINKLKEFEWENCKEGSCAVCQDDYMGGDKVIELPCKHTYHKDCVSKWLKMHDSCPNCRCSINPNGQQASN